MKVDPRVRGGDSIGLHSAGLSPGRSPRARGRLFLLSLLVVIYGSIPACAGETLALNIRIESLAVDPRVRGGDVSPAWEISPS